MGFFKNWKSDRNAGKLKVEEQRVEDIKNKTQRTPKDQKNLDKHLYILGVSQNRQIRYNTPKTIVDNSTKQNYFTLGSNNTTKKGLNDNQTQFVYKSIVDSSKPKKTTKSKPKKKK